MGLPEHPENGENQNQLAFNNAAPIFINNPNDDDDGDENEYSGYEPLGHSGGLMNIPYATDDDEDDGDSDDSDNEFHNAEIIPEPQAPCPEAEIEREVWSAPRPTELNIELDTTKTEQILSAMAAILLPTSAIPDWAQNVPEEKWKEDLLVKIRGKQETKTTTSNF